MRSEQIDTAYGPCIIMKRYYISYGAKVKMYTLWVNNCCNPVDVADYRRRIEAASSDFPYSFRQNIGPCFSNTRYLQNLSVDAQQALAKACELTGWEASEIETEDLDEELRPILKGEDVLHFGKYEGQRIEQLIDIKYLNWLAKGAKLEQVNDRTGERYWDSISPIRKNPILVELAKDRLLELGAWRVYKGQKMSKERAEKLEGAAGLFQESQFGHHLEDGQRVKGLDLELLEANYYDSAYGTYYVASFRDQTGRIFKYKGGTPWWIGPSVNCHNEEGKVIFHNPVQVTFTVKHGEYKGVKETLISRPKVGKFVDLTQDVRDELTNAYKLYSQNKRLSVQESH